MGSVRPPRSIRLRTCMNQDPAPAAPQRGFGRVLCAKPLLTISKRSLPLEQPMGFAAMRPDLERYGRSVHFVGLSTTIEPYNDGGLIEALNHDTAENLAQDHLEVSRRFPSARFIILANTELEVFELSRRGVPCLLANELMFTADEAFSIEPSPSRRPFAAVYNASLRLYKRHELADRIDRLLLIVPEAPPASRFAQVQAHLPRATFANLEDGRRLRWLSPRDLSATYANCSVGLCLSAAEGAMRASIEYLLCGLPVVTTHNRGGRDRYLRSEYAIFVEPDPDAVADAVSQLAVRRIPRDAIRADVLRNIAIDRQRFLLEVNSILSKIWPDIRGLDSFSPFLYYPIWSSQLDRSWMTF